MYTMNIRNKYSNEDDCLTDWKCKYNDS